MSHKDIGILLGCLILVQGFIVIVISYGFYGQYFKNAANQSEALRKLRIEKPIAAKIIGALYALCLIDLLVAILLNIGGALISTSQIRIHFDLLSRCLGS